MKKSEIITRDIINYINFKIPKSKREKELTKLKVFISKSDLFKGDKKKLYKLVNEVKNNDKKR